MTDDLVNEITMNRMKTVMLLATLTAVLLWAGHALAGLLRLFSTHPPTEARIQRLEAWR